MDWSERMNAAIAYIEENLKGDIDIAAAAERACCSSYHFQRMFFAVIDMTPAEYIRKRRLTLAAGELSAGTCRVIDVALKYGYDSPEAFSRAFRKLHGISPLAARQPGAKLTAVPRISFHIELKGGTLMDYRIFEKPAFDLVGRSETFCVASGEFNSKGRSFWRKYVGEDEYKTLAGLTAGQNGPVTGAPVMTAYLPNESGTWDPVVNFFGVEKTDDMDTGDFEIVHIPAAMYAEFNCTFRTSAATNKRIYGEWFPATGFERDDKADIAAFFQVPWASDIYVRWWIPVLVKG